MITWCLCFLEIVQPFLQHFIFNVFVSCTSAFVDVSRRGILQSHTLSDAEDEKGQTALDLAAKKSNYDVVNYLTELEGTNKR